MTETSERSLSWGQRLGWGIGSLGGTTLINGVTFLALFYLSSVLGMEPALAGGLLFGAKLFDIVTDPLMGVLSDRTRSRWGRRRPWLFVAAFVSAGSFVMLFSGPALQAVSSRSEVDMFQCGASDLQLCHIDADTVTRCSR